MSYFDEARAATKSPKTFDEHFLHELKPKTLS